MPWSKTLVFADCGDVGENHHVAPVHPDYAPLPPLKRDVEGAKKLLKEAGFPNGLEVTIDVGNTDGPWHQTACEAMRDQMKEAGITLNVNVMPAAKYWEIWTKTPFGVHRLDASPARHDGDVARLSHRRAVERDPLCQSGVRQGA